MPRMKIEAVALEPLTGAPLSKTRFGANSAAWETSSTCSASRSAPEKAVIATGVFCSGSSRLRAVTVISSMAEMASARASDACSCACSCAHATPPAPRARPSAIPAIPLRCLWLPDMFSSSWNFYLHVSQIQAILSGKRRASQTENGPPPNSVQKTKSGQKGRFGLEFGPDSQIRGKGQCPERRAAGPFSAGAAL